MSVDAHKIAQHVEMQRTRLKAVGATIAQALQMWLLPLFLPFCEPRRGDKERLRRGSPTATAIRLPVSDNPGSDRGPGIGAEQHNFAMRGLTSSRSTKDAAIKAVAVGSAARLSRPAKSADNRKFHVFLTLNKKRSADFWTPARRSIPVGERRSASAVMDPAPPRRLRRSISGG